MKTKDAKRKANRKYAAALWVCATVVLYSVFDLRFSLLLAQAPTFRTGTTLVEFTVVALDGKGNPVPDLTKDDLALTDRGQPRDIAFFRFDGDGAPAEAAAPLPALSRLAPLRGRS